MTPQKHTALFVLLIPHLSLTTAQAPPPGDGAPAILQAPTIRDLRALGGAHGRRRGGAAAPLPQHGLHGLESQRVISGARTPGPRRAPRFRENRRDQMKYWAFISYSHRDAKWATWLHRALESYRVPVDAPFAAVSERSNVYPNRSNDMTTLSRAAAALLLCGRRSRGECCGDQLRLRQREPHRCACGASFHHRNPAPHHDAGYRDIRGSDKRRIPLRELLRAGLPDHARETRPVLSESHG